MTICPSEFEPVLLILTQKLIHHLLNGFSTVTMVTRALQDLPRYRLSTHVNDELPSKCYAAVIHFTIFKLYWFNIVKIKATLGNKAKNQTKTKQTKQKNGKKNKTKFKRKWEKRAQNTHKTF